MTSCWLLNILGNSVVVEATAAVKKIPIAVDVKILITAENFADLASPPPSSLDTLTLQEFKSIGEADRSK